MFGHFGVGQAGVEAQRHHLRGTGIHRFEPGERTLEHEQTHFDLSEVYARRMRRYFGNLFRPCDQPLERWRQVAEKFVRDEASAQDRYDDETRHGLVADRQRAWTADVARQLTEP